jgi:PKD repeat protein
MLNGKVKIIINQDGMSAAIVDMVMFSSDFGWAKWNTANCKTHNTANANGSADISCTSVTKIIKTVDGGITWDAILFPKSGSDALTNSYNATYPDMSPAKAASQGNTQLFVGQGFDLCEIPTLSQLQTWWANSPFKTVNLYIGGSARACPNIILSASYLDQVRQQGWSFIPIWAGPQAPCRPSGSRFSDDVSTAYMQGVDEANLAVERLATLDLTYEDKTGSVIYYDLEPYGTDPGCRDAVNAFVNGWVTRLHARGNLAGMYASTSCNQGLSDFRGIANVPDVIWPYRWYHQAGQGSYNPAASVWDLGGCVPTNVWANHQRIRQYEGAHNETWGGVTLNIDNDVLDGVVAIPYYGVPTANFYALPQSGNAPLTVAMHIVDTSYMTSCSWNYGDGQTGVSCASSHNHTYNSPGTYTVSLTVSGPGGSDNMTRNNYIVVGQPGQPDLVPYPRVGRQDPVIISSVPGTSTNGTLYAGQQIFIDWGIKNIGNADINTSYYVDLDIDNQPFIHSSFTGLSAGALSGFDDWGLTWNISGWHTVNLIVDPENGVSESSKNNNVWVGQFYWESPIPNGLTTISPTGTISEIAPAYVWNAATGIASYELYVYSLGSASHVFSITPTPASSICSVGICTYNSSPILSLGDYQFMVVARNLNGTSTFSAWTTFTVGGVPIAPTTVSPTGPIMDTTPSYVWIPSVAASSYDLYVYSYGSANPVVSNSSIPASSNCTAGTCTWTPSTTLTRGSYQFNVRARNLSGVSDFSVWGTFTVDTGDYDTYRIYLPLVIR